VEFGTIIDNNLEVRSLANENETFYELKSRDMVRMRVFEIKNTHMHCYKNLWNLRVVKLLWRIPSVIAPRFR